MTKFLMAALAAKPNLSDAAGKPSLHPAQIKTELLADGILALGLGFLVLWREKDEPGIR